MVADTTPKFGLDGKVVLVTGASRGIGRACALGCAGCGRRRDRRRAQGGRRRCAGRRDREPGRPGAGGANGPDRPRHDAERSRHRTQGVRPHRRAGQQCRPRPREPGGERHRGRFRPHRRRQPQGHFLHHAGCRQADDRPKIRTHHQHQLAGRQRDAEGRGDLLHDQGRDQPSDALPCRRMGARTASRSTASRRPSSGPTARGRALPIRASMRMCSATSRSAASATRSTWRERWCSWPRLPPR